MKTQKTSLRMTAMMILTGGSLLGFGGCVPDNFFADALGAALSTTAATVYDATVLTPLSNSLTGGA